MKHSFQAALLGVLALTCGISTASARPWKFGIMGDTQWKSSPDGKNPNTVAVSVINKLNEQFIAQGVKFVVQVGDLVDTSSNLSLDTRATFAQALYNSGIGFYPLRGNHESSSAAALETQRVFPQTRDGVNNRTPTDALVTTPYYGAPPGNTNTPFTIGTNFQSFPGASNGYDGLFYAFDFANARFVLMDQFTPATGSAHSVLDADQVAWVGGVLAARPERSHAFVFAHKGIITENHGDTLFGSDPSANPTLQNLFIANLANSGVRYFMGGHDHMHNRALVTSPDSSSVVENIIIASDSFKFYVPTDPSIDERYDNPNRETPLSQDLFTIGYYVVTVDGPRVSVDYFASPNGCGGDCDLTNDTIPYTFAKRETFGYSLNGQAFLVEAGDTYATISDSFGETSMRILDGYNEVGRKDYGGRYLSHEVNTGWKHREHGAASDRLTLWGMSTMGEGMGAAQTDEYVLSMTFDRGPGHSRHGRGQFGLQARDASGAWVSAASLTGQTPVFVLGPWQPWYGLGVHGVDPKTRTAWAVINFQGDFRVADLDLSGHHGGCDHEE